MAWKRGTLRSSNCRGVRPSRAAVCSIFDAVLVGAGEEEHVVAVEPHEAGDGVGGDRLIGVADMRRAVRIGDRGGDVIGFAGHFGLSAPHNDQWPGQARPRTAHRYQPRVASASKPKTLKTSGFRSKL